MTRRVLDRDGVTLSLTTEHRADVLRLCFSLSVPEETSAWLHWGLDGADGRWQAPPESSWPLRTQPFDAHAVQSPFDAHESGEQRLALEIPKALDGRELRFVLYLEEPARWINDGGRDLELPLDVLPRRRPADVLGSAPEVQLHELAAGRQLAWRIEAEQGAPTRLRLASNLRLPLFLHWGVVERGRRWIRPPSSCWPEGTKPAGEQAVESPFEQLDGLAQLSVEIDAPGARGVIFVLRHGEHWLKRGGSDFYLPLAAESSDEQEPPLHAPRELAETIVEAETGRGSWTLMHRFNLCHELVERLPGDEAARAQALTALYVWLRFSALRQLDWQRNYNTKPRELAHAQERLTRQLAALYGRDRSSRELLRLMLTTMGHGTDGQRVRDEILEIMHRHRIKEVTGHFMEEWHQKLHNNTTYDDVVICEGYLAFLRSDGDQELFYDYLAAHGVTRERLEGYERPIVTPPDFHAGLKDALLHDFGRYLVTLKRVHQGTDLGVAFERASGQLPQELRQKLELLLDSGTKEPLASCRRLVTARHGLRPMLDTGAGARDLLFLDLALDERLRLIVESTRQEIDSLDSWLQLSWAAAENTALSFEDQELARCARHLRLLSRAPELDIDRARELYAVRERTSRALAGLSDRLHRTLQPWASYLGSAFGAEDFTVDLFSEEVIRGRAPFALSATLRGLAGPLRAAARLGEWEVVSPGHATGRLRRVAALRELIDAPPQEPTVALCERVHGDEEVPSTVVAILTSATVDLVSHVAVRARNASVLLLTAYDAAMLECFTEHEGRELELRLSADQELAWSPIDGASRVSPTPATEHAPTHFPELAWDEEGPWALAEERYDDARVGAKSRNLSRLRRSVGKEAVSIPRAFALPFGCCERALARCPALQEEHDALLGALQGASHEEQGALFAALRRLMTSIEEPPSIADALRRAAQQAGVPWPAQRWPQLWQRIKSVWASKWNERAARARRARGMPDAALSMAVLVQELVPGELAFVLHSADPRSGERGRLYGEVVVGLGETLVGNHPGRALSFVGDKRSLEIEVLAFPSKSYALRGSGLIFRSDSSGEDLAGYAGAGLYDSFPLDENERVPIDYTRVPSVADSDLRHELLVGLLKLGTSIEARFGCPQDVEGVVLKKGYHVVQTRPQVGLDERV